MDLAYGLFMAETNGLLDTHESKVQKLLKDLKAKAEYGLDSWVIDDLYLSNFGLKIEDLTAKDLRRIESAAR